MRSLSVNLKSKSYRILIEDQMSECLFSYIEDNFSKKKIFIITDDNVNGLYGEGIKTRLEKQGNIIKVAVVPAGERSKSIECSYNLYRSLADFRIDREDLILTLGGGVVGDLGGYVAATYLRGIPFIQIPTTLLAQVDSSIGGKVAVNLPWGKNLVGSFYHPEAVFINTSFLKSLKPRVFNDGMGEVIKYGCIKDDSIIEKLKVYKNSAELYYDIEDLVYRCCYLKKNIVEEDEKDYGVRMLLNFGHTLGHAIEKYFNYKKYTHGEAISIGMYEMVKKGEEKGLTDLKTSEALVELLRKYELPTELPILSKADLIKYIEYDKKKNNDSLNLIMLKRFGNSFVKKIKLDEISQYI